MNGIKVSIIVPVYDTEQYLRRCLDTLVNQTLQEVEIICINDKSPDNSIVILREYENKYPGKIIVIDSPENLRQGGARNLGIKTSKGQYIGFVDSDDYISLDMYELLYKKAIINGIDIVGCDLVSVKEGAEQIIKQFRFLENTINEKKVLDKETKEMLITKSGSIVSKIYKRSMIIKNHIFFPEKLSYEDNFFCPVAAFYANSFDFIPQGLYYYWQDNLTSTTTIRNSNHHLNRITTAEMLLDWFKEADRERVYKDAMEYLFTEYYYVHTVSTLIHYYDDINYKKIKEVRERFLSEYPHYYKNKYYIKEFSTLKRLVFRINDYSVYIYALLYKMVRKVND